MNTPPPESGRITRELKEQAISLGFGSVAVCPAVPAAGFDRFREWLARGYGGKMRYLETRLEAYRHPRHVLDGVRSIVMLTLNYRTTAPRRPVAGQGRISRYAWGSADYHEVIRGKLQTLTQWLAGRHPASHVRGIVDTAPVFERELAQLAGLGWIGKHTLLLNRTAGSWFFLAALLTDIELEYDAPHHTEHCGTCTACLDSCPTGAFPAAYVLDATRCISYLTIELREPVSTDLRGLVGDWVFGCDVCQEVCPWNRHAPLASEPKFAPLTSHDPVDLAPLFDMTDTEFRERFRHTPLWRSKRRGLLRNAALVLGNQRAVAAVAALSRGLHDPEPLVRGACAWALGRIDHEAARAALRVGAQLEQAADVMEEIKSALADDA